MSKAKDRKIIFEKYGGHCAYCGDELKKGWHVDHILPVNRLWRHKQKDGEMVYGKNGYVKEYYYEYPERDVIENKMPSCPSCNINKHQATIEEFRAWITRYVVSLNKSNTQYQMAKKYGLIQETGKLVTFYFENFPAEIKL